MKKSINLILCLVAMATLCAASCGDNNEPSGNDTYADMFVGTWRVDNVTVNGAPMTPENLLIIMNEDGSGVLSDDGVTENNEFTWSVDGDQLTIVQRHGTLLFTINNIDENECTFSGNTVPGFDEPMGNVVIHVVRVR